jgi:ATP-binding cassette subfamily F protein 3
VAVVIASDLAKDMAGEPLWKNVSFKLERRDRLTIAGRNGAGKTTLLRILAGETGIDGGEVVFAKGTRIALHDQRPPRERGLTLRDYVLSGNREPLELEEQLRALEEQMAGGDEKVYDRYARVMAQYESVGGYNWREGANSVIHGLGFTDADLDRSLQTFSGGQLTRASLARALSARPDLLLLDEPTNHLDIESLEWLEKTLQELDAAIVLIAHDRWFLEAVGTAVLEIEAGRGRFFKGTWHTWRREQAARELALGRAIEKQQAEIARMEQFVERFRAKATKARQAQSRVKALDKIERIERDPRDTREMGFQFKKPERSGRVIFELVDGHIEVPGRVLIDKGELWIEREEHVSLVGPNGVGKTTLIDALAGRRPLDGGRLRLGHNVQVGYLSQHGEELEHGDARTVLEACAKQTKLSPQQARALLGKFLFSGEEAEKLLEGLSGGERKRLGLAILVSSGANVLILDEPTNHLDLESREALEDALLSFPGALLLVSHDRALLEAVGTRTIAVEEYGLRSYVGGWQEYWAAREAAKLAGRTPPPPPKPTGMASAKAPERGPDGMALKRSEDLIRESEAPPQGAARAAAAVGHKNGAAKNGGTGKAAGAAAVSPAPGALSKNRARQLARLEGSVEQAELNLAATEEELADPSAWATSYETAKSTARHTKAKRAVEAAYAELEAYEAAATA